MISVSWSCELHYVVCLFTLYWVAPCDVSTMTCTTCVLCPVSCLIYLFSYPVIKLMFSYLSCIFFLSLVQYFYMSFFSVLSNNVSYIIPCSVLFLVLYFPVICLVLCHVCFVLCHVLCAHQCILQCSLPGILPGYLIRIILAFTIFPTLYTTFNTSIMSQEVSC